VSRRLGPSSAAGTYPARSPVLKSFGDEILNVEKVSGNNKVNIIPGMDNLVRVMNAIVEALRARTSGAFLFKSYLRISVWAIRLTPCFVQLLQGFWRTEEEARRR
jgi:hypothetical protein